MLQEATVGVEFCVLCVFVGLGIFGRTVTSSQHNIDLLASKNSFLWKLFASYIHDKRFGVLVMHYQLSLSTSSGVSLKSSLQLLLYNYTNTKIHRLTL